VSIKVGLCEPYCVETYDFWMNNSSGYKDVKCEQTLGIKLIPQQSNPDQSKTEPLYEIETKRKWH